MDEKFGLKSIMKNALLATVLIFGVASIGYAGGPQPGQEGLVFEGKAVDGLLNAVVVDPAVTDQNGVLGDVAPFIVEYIVLSCKEADVTFGPAINFPIIDLINFDQIKAECEQEGDRCLEGWVFEGAADNLPQSACFPDAVEGLLDDIIITRVKNFIKTDTSISAEVTLRLGQQ